MKLHRRSSLLLLLAVAIALGAWWYRQWREHRYDPLIAQAAQRHGVDPALVKAVIWQESWFDASARGRAGERGLMQIREPAALDWTRAERIPAFQPDHLLDPATNTLAGTWYLASLLKRYRSTDQSAPYALADYNAGRTHVLRWMQGAARTNHSEFLARIDFPGTRRYIERILRARPRFAPDFPPPAIPSITNRP